MEVSTLEEEEREEGHASMETVEPANKTISENNPNMQRSIVNGKTRGKCKMRSSSENSAGEVKSQKDQLDCSANYVLVFCHLEMLRFTVSAELHITQVSLFQIIVVILAYLLFIFASWQQPSQEGDLQTLASSILWPHPVSIFPQNKKSLVV